MTASRRGAAVGHRVVAGSSDARCRGGKLGSSGGWHAAPARLARWMVVTAASSVLVASAGCDVGGDLTEDWVEQAAERNREALLETQREELPLPEGVPVHRYEVEDFERPDDFGDPLVEDLVIAERGGERSYLFDDPGRPGVSLFRTVAADDAGRIHVLDRGVPEVRVFDPDGGFLRRFGRVGEGPGDIIDPRGIALARGRVLIFHRRYRTSVWTSDGQFVEDRRTIERVDVESLVELGAEAEGPTRRREGQDRSGPAGRAAGGEVDGDSLWPEGVFGLADGSSIAAYRVRVGRRRGRVVTRSLQVVSRFRDGEETVRHIAVPNWSRAGFAASPDGGLYVGMFGHLRTEHFIVALDPEGAPRWMIVNAWSPDRPPQVELRVDGRGRLWAFPWVPMAEEVGRGSSGGDRSGAAGEPAEPGRPSPRPAWVFSPDGELLAVGSLDRRPLFWNWQVARGDHVYGIRRDAASLGEWEVVRYRLDVPL